MIPDPVTLGIAGTGLNTVFNTVENGPGARTKRAYETDVNIESDLITVQQQYLTISHSPATAKGRDRSLFRLDADYIGAAALANGLSDQSASGAAYIVLDLPGVRNPGGAYREQMAKFLLSRLLGFLSENATGAPDFDFSSNENVLKWIAKEP
jgi:hypothetical protein